MNAPTRIDDPTLSWARVLALTEGVAGLEIRAALREHVGNILSRLSNEAQAQVLVAEAWGQEADRAYDGTDALEQLNQATGRAQALAWIQGALTSVHGMAVVPVPFEVPAHWNTVPPEPEEETNDCPTCGGSGGGSESHLRCYECGGSGVSRVALAAKREARADAEFDRWKDERAEREFHATNDEAREEARS